MAKQSTNKFTKTEQGKLFKMFFSVADLIQNFLSGEIKELDKEAVVMCSYHRGVVWV